MLFYALAVVAIALVAGLFGFFWNGGRVGFDCTNLDRAVPCSFCAFPDCGHATKVVTNILDPRNAIGVRVF